MERDLTERTVSTLKVPNGSRDVWAFDRKLKGFGIRKFDTGRASYFVKFSIAGKRRHVTLGPVVEGKLSDMRARAANVITEALAGRDVIAKEKSASAKPALILSELIEKYLADRKPKLRPRYIVELTRQLRRDWKPLHSMAVEAITRQHVVLTIDDIATRYGDTTADRAKAALSACYTWAMERSIVGATPVLNIKARTNNQRDRVLTEAELAIVWKACCGKGDYGRIIRLLILTGQRCSEIADLSWPEVDLAKCEITLPGRRTKNKRLHIVPLSPEAIALLPEPTEGRAFLFGRGRGGFSGWSRAKHQLEAAITAANGQPLAPWTLHDLRRSYVTHLAERRIATPWVIESLVNHVSGSKGGIAGIYNRALHSDEKREAMLTWGKYVGSLAK